MSAQSTIATMHDLEAVGVPREHAAAIADAIAGAQVSVEDLATKAELVTKTYLDGRLNALELRLLRSLGGWLGGLIVLGFTVLGFLVVQHK